MMLYGPRTPTTIRLKAVVLVYQSTSHRTARIDSERLLMKLWMAPTIRHAGHFNLNHIMISSATMIALIQDTASERMNSKSAEGVFLNYLVFCSDLQEGSTVFFESLLSNLWKVLDLSV